MLRWLLCILGFHGPTTKTRTAEFVHHGKGVGRIARVYREVCSFCGKLLKEEDDTYRKQSHEELRPPW